MSTSKILDIAQELKKEFLDELPRTSEISLFLCGGGSAEELRFRRQIGKKISQIKSKYLYSVYYPEDMFIELILGHQRKDLLSLEDLLATGANCVVILLQSPGTFSELGAFTNYSELKNKLVVVIEPKYKHSRSFISLGPIRFLETRTQSKVLYYRMDTSNLDFLSKEIAEASRNIARHSTPINDLSNPIASCKFYLSLIYVFDLISKDYLSALIEKLADNESTDKITALTVYEAVLGGLFSERKIAYFSDKLSITPKGINDLVYDNKTKRRSSYIISLLSKFRIDTLNITLRRKYYKEVWAAR